MDEITLLKEAYETSQLYEAEMLDLAADSWDAWKIAQERTKKAKYRLTKALESNAASDILSL